MKPTEPMNIIYQTAIGCCGTVAGESSRFGACKALCRDRKGAEHD